MQIALALALTIISACGLNLGYLLQHQVASSLPPLSLRRPLASLRSLLVERRWLLGFGIQAGGFVLYVVALALAPLSLVQATAAGGIGILAIMVSRITHVPLTRLEQVGAAVSVVGLALLGLSLFSTHGEGSGATYAWVGVWLAASAAGAVLCVTLLARAIGRATAGLSTLLTNALPIAAGMVLFYEPLPSALIGGVRIAAFAAVVAGAVLLAARGKDVEPRPRTRDAPSLEPIPG
jgi:hypothetical protein